ncbi:DDE-type integrase/transposase/recombinase [Roseobacter sp. MH60115]|uniref:DDE-type integrase/transposase/recombinase n=1 Tax=Roseobacter sp. MH60115 TaxID=2785324 RepID=UPI0018A256F7|nr:DDE-type integrase/transposase/recombinase [Roseobacter sp. MH60115]
MSLLLNEWASAPHVGVPPAYASGSIPHEVALMLTVLDEYTREALCVAVRPKMNAGDVLDVLHRLLMKHGKPEYIRSDNGPEFIAAPLQDWLRRVGIQPMQIYPGSPWENGYNERRKVRDVGEVVEIHFDWSFPS